MKDATAGYRHPPPVESLARLAELADIVVECLPAAVFLDVAEPALRAGRRSSSPASASCWRSRS